MLVATLRIENSLDCLLLMINFPILTKSILLTFFGNVDKLSFFPLEQHKTLYLEIGS